jgi:hypothetical protein
MTSSTSTLPFPVDHMLRMLTLTNGMMDELVPVPGDLNGEFTMNPGPVATLGMCVRDEVKSN